MLLSEFTNALNEVETMTFQLPNGEMVPAHFHITEIGLTTKNYIDCGGTVRVDQKISLQLWTADDTDHRLTVEKTKKIVALSQSIISSNDAEIEVEYQQDTIGKFGLQYSNKSFQLTATQTACLAWDACSVPKEKEKLNLANLVSNESSCCTPGGGCC